MLQALPYLFGVYRDLFSPSPFMEKKGFTFSSHSHGKWQLEYLDTKSGLTYFAVGMNTQGLGDPVLASRTTSSEKNQESYSTTRLCITRSTEEER